MIEPTDNPAPEVEVPTEPVTEPEIVTNEVGSEPEPDAEDQSTATPDGDTAEETEAPDEGRMLKADYTRKTQELAEIRKALTERTQRLDQYVTQGEALVNVLAQEFQTDFGSINWIELARADPAEAVFKQTLAAQRYAKLQEAIGKLNQAKQQQTQIDQELSDADVLEEQKRLLEKVPEWKNQKTWSAEANDLAQYLMDQGYPPDAIRKLHRGNHLDVVTARKAMLYDRMQAKLPKAKPQTTAPPPPPPAPSKAKAAPSLETMSMREFMATRNKAERRA